MTIDRSPVQRAVVRGTAVNSGPQIALRQPTASERAHMEEIEEMINMGWGETPQIKIPSNWRTERGPSKRMGI